MKTTTKTLALCLLTLCLCSNALARQGGSDVRRKNVIPGERMPDPSTDDSFKRFMKNEKFLAALKELNP